MRTRILFVTAFAWATLNSVVALAQPASAQAEHLFREGKRLMADGNIAEACGAFEASYANDPAVSTLLNLADCREKNHQYASAWGYFIDAARLTRGKPDQANLNKTASDRAAKIEDRLSYLIINVPAEAQVEGLAITLNGKPIKEPEWNRRVPVDGGEYTIEGKAPAHEPWSSKAKVAAAKDTRSVTVPRFHPSPSDAISSSETAEPPEGSSGQAGSMTGRRKVAIAAWAVGAVGLGVGISFELSARSTRDEAFDEVTDYERQQELYDSANQKRWMAGAAVGVGAAAAGIGVFLWVSGKPSKGSAIAVAPRFSQDGGELVVLGRF